MMAREDHNGILVVKWRDVRDARILSIKHAHIMTPSSDSIHCGHPSKVKLAIIAYNNGVRNFKNSKPLESSKHKKHDQIWAKITTPQLNNHENTNKKGGNEIPGLLVTKWLSSGNTIPDNESTKMKKVSPHIEVRKISSENVLSETSSTFEKRIL